MATSGLLLTPEKTVWSEFRQDGTKSPPIEVFQKRSSFTELAPSELEEHGRLFGPFALEFEIESLRLLGAIPVFYLPTPGTEERALGGVAAALVARMAEVQQMLARLTEISLLVANTANKNELLDVTINGKPAGRTRCTIGGAEDLLNILTHQAQPVQELLNAFRALSGFFYPTENFEYTGPLAYYRQREWRIINAVMHRGREISRPITEAEGDELINIDREFFEKRLRFPTGEYRRIEQCRYIADVGGRPFLDWARRVIVPDEVVERASEILWTAAMPTPVTAASAVADGHTSAG